MHLNAGVMQAVTSRPYALQSYSDNGYPERERNTPACENKLVKTLVPLMNAPAQNDALSAGVSHIRLSPSHSGPRTLPLIATLTTPIPGQLAHREANDVKSFDSSALCGRGRRRLGTIPVPDAGL
ncbi:hypothetical protein E2C01_037420 [Portunus trituberculatus]|uniref:Uncharacterized protein n=1 Tax=Portunus trituberculatus TaxID=210409 RepID=A0A5B7FFK3_PORTR|nr:hypothetical protein [Portunus trituberculatus]